MLGAPQIIRICFAPYCTRVVWDGSAAERFKTKINTGKTRSTIESHHTFCLRFFELGSLDLFRKVIPTKIYMLPDE